MPHSARVSVVAADSLAKRDVFRLPDPFAIVTVDGEQTKTTAAIKVSSDPVVPPRSAAQAESAQQQPTQS